jgi:hypothetical protein
MPSRNLFLVEQYIPGEEISRGATRIFPQATTSASTDDGLIVCACGKVSAEGLDQGRTCSVGGENTGVRNPRDARG